MKKASHSSCCSYLLGGFGGLFSYLFGYSQPNPEKQQLLISQLKELVELSKQTLAEQDDIYHRLETLENEAVSHYEALTQATLHYRKPKHPFFESRENSPQKESSIQPEKFTDLRLLLRARPKFDGNQIHDLNYIRAFSDELSEHHEKVKELASICFKDLYYLNERAALVREKLENTKLENTMGGMSC